MSTHSTETSRGTDTDRGAQATGRSRVVQLVSNVTGLDRGRSALVLTGAALLARAARTASRNRRRAALQALAGAALIGVGFRRRLMGSRGEATAGGAGDDPTSGTPTSEQGEEHEVSAEAHAHLDRSDVMHQDESNPRGTSGEPDVETATEPDEGDVQFTTEHDEEPHPKPDLADEGAEDPRLNDADDNAVEDDVEIDLSEAAMADEASEATGPTDEQAYPAQEGTDPEPSAPEAPETHTESTDAEASAGAEDDEPDAEADESDAAADEEAGDEPGADDGSA